MKVFKIIETDPERARAKLASELGIPGMALKFVGQENDTCSFQAYSVPAKIDTEVTVDGMKLLLLRLRPPIGDRFPKLSTDFVLGLLKEKGFVKGIKVDVLAKEVHRILQSSDADDRRPLNIVIAEGQKPSPGEAGRVEWAFDLALAAKGEKIYLARKGEVIARAPAQVPGKPGFKVTGEEIPPALVETQRVVFGYGIEMKSTPTELQYLAKTTGRILVDQGLRPRLEARILRLAEGLDAGVELPGSLTVTGQKISGQDLIDLAKDQGVVFGFLSTQEIEAAIATAKTWPAVITVAKGEKPFDGLPGLPHFLHKTPKTENPSPVDLERMKEGIVFPGEDILVIRSPNPPKDGKSAFGDVIKANEPKDLPVFPGRGVTRETRNGEIYFKATTYGRVKQEEDRVSVLSVASLAKDAMAVTIDLFPQVLIPVQDALNTLREMEVLIHVDKDKLENELKAAHQAGKRIPQFPLVRGRAPITGSDAKITYNFDVEHLKEKGLFNLKTRKVYWAAPGDLIMTKILAQKPEDGQNVFRERIAVSKMTKVKDIELNVGKLIDEVDVGEEGDPQNPARIEYRALTFGNLVLKNNVYDLQPLLQIDKNEMEAKLLLSPKSDFGTKITEDILKAFAKSEEFRVDLELETIRKFLNQKGEVEPEEVVIAKAQQPQHGEAAKIRYFVQFNGKPIEESLGAGKKDEAPLICDCVRPGDVLAIKTPATNGVDGKTIFGRRIPADRGLDEPFPAGFGVEKSKDGTQIFSSLTGAGYVMVERGKIAIRSTAVIGKDKMSVTVSLYPSKNPRFMTTEEKVSSMLRAMGIMANLKSMTLRDALDEMRETMKPIENLVVAEGRPPHRGRDAILRFTIDTGNTVGEIRADGSIDFKNKNIFQSVKKGQLLLIKQPPAKGEDGMDVKGAIIPGNYGSDVALLPGNGVEISSNGLEYRATLNGILEVLPKTIRVIPGLLINGDVATKTGNVHSTESQIFVTGSVLPDFEVTSTSDISIEKVAEACRIVSQGDLKIRGGIIGRDRGFYSAKGNVETMYVQAGATVEAGGDIIVRTEVLNSKLVAAGNISCTEGHGAIVGGEVYCFKTLKVRTLGTAGAETPTVIHLGMHVLALRLAEAEVERQGLKAQIQNLKEVTEAMNLELRKIYDQIPEVTKTSFEEAQKLQTAYRALYDQRNEKVAQLQGFEKRRDEILGQVPTNKDSCVQILEAAHPGTVFIFGDVQWVLKEPLRSVEVRWNQANANFYTKRI